ncbi:PREDICTED: THAP domain-containing protein 2-like isoform X2 [Vollenhovia emeryi]|nr:PREDICTED: THAP domain-containing protein 2-like isoform X2 [Vollenhovia emeryi]
MKIKNWTPNNSSFLCSQHFEQTCFHKKKGKYVALKDGSVPTIFEIENFDNPKSAVVTSTGSISTCKTEFSQKISLNDKDRFKFSQQTFRNEFRNEIETHLADKNTDKSLQRYRQMTFKKSELISFVDHDHCYDISPSLLRRKLKHSQELLKNKEKLIKLQKQQLKRLKTRITGLKKTVMELRCQHDVKKLPEVS